MNIDGQPGSLLEAVDQSVKALREGIDMHYCLVAQVLGRQGGAGLDHLTNLCPSRSRETRLREAIEEAIDVLEESRKAFKSKKLEMLRKKLTRVLIDLQ